MQDFLSLSQMGEARKKKHRKTQISNYVLPFAVVGSVAAVCMCVCWLVYSEVM